MSDSKYAVELDRKSQALIENENLSDDYSDVLLMSSSQFRANFPNYVRSEINVSKYISDIGNMVDAKGNNFGTLVFTTAEKPKITFESGSFPCSLITAFDSQGNFAVLHLFRYEKFMDPPMDIDDEQRILDFLTFIDKDMQDDFRIVISATNVTEILRKKVEDSLRANLSSVDSNKISTLYVKSELYKIADSNSPGYLPSTKDHINAVYFIPKEFSQDGKNKVCFVGDTADANPEDAIWLSSHFSELFPRRPYN